MPFELLVVAALALFTLIMMTVTIQDSTLDRRLGRRAAEPTSPMPEKPPPSMSVSSDRASDAQFERVDERMAA